MTKFSTIVYCILITICFCACREKKVTVNHNVEVIKIDSLTEFTTLNFSDIFDTVGITPLENKESLVGEIYQLDIDNDSVYILDQSKAHAIYLFDGAGHFKKNIGQIGRGPGEYQNLGNFFLDKTKNEFFVYNNGNNILVYDSKTTDFKRSIKLDYFMRDFVVLDDDLLLVYLNYRTNRNFDNLKGYNVLLINKNGEVVKRMFPYKTNAKNHSSPNKSFFYTSEKGDILFVPAYSDTIYHFDKVKKDFSAKYVVDFGIQSKKQDNIDSKTTYIQSLVDSDDFLYFSFNYEGKKNYAFYSKETKKIRFANLILNDLKCFLTFTDIFHFHQGNFIADAPVINMSYFKKITNIGEFNSVDYKGKLISYVEKLKMGSDKRKEFIDRINQTKFQITDEDVRFLNSIEEFGNPMLLKLKIKKF